MNWLHFWSFVMLECVEFYLYVFSWRFFVDVFKLAALWLFDSILFIWLSSPQSWGVCCSSQVSILSSSFIFPCVRNNWNEYQKDLFVDVFRNVAAVSEVTLEVTTWWEEFLWSVARCCDLDRTWSTSWICSIYFMTAAKSMLYVSLWSCLVMYLLVFTRLAWFECGLSEICLSGHFLFNLKSALLHCDAFLSMVMYFYLNLLNCTAVRWLWQRLDEVGIPIPNYALVNRDFPDQEVDHFVEEEDYVEINGKRILKPFVEKPVDGMLVLSATFWQYLLFALFFSCVTILWPYLFSVCFGSIKALLLPGEVDKPRPWHRVRYFLCSESGLYFIC